MEKIINLGNPHTFNELENIPGDELRKLRDDLLPLYNTAITLDGGEQIQKLIDKQNVGRE